VLALAGAIGVLGHLHGSCTLAVSSNWLGFG
jgi:hypothetical protein